MDTCIFPCPVPAELDWKSNKQQLQHHHHHQQQQHQLQCYDVNKKVMIDTDSNIVWSWRPFTPKACTGIHTRQLKAFTAPNL
eukprot:1142574-Pelagomonas_calceolata.AAC.2